MDSNLVSDFALEETLKTIRMTYRLLLILCATTALLWLSNERNEQTPSDQLRALSEIDYSKFRSWAEEKVRLEIINSDIKEDIIHKVKSSGQLTDEQIGYVERSVDGLLKDLSDPPSFSIELPPSNATISELGIYIKKNPKVELLLPDLDRVVNGYLYTTKFMLGRMPWKPIEIGFLKGDRNSQLFRIYVRSNSHGADTSGINHISVRGYTGVASLHQWMGEQPPSIRGLIETRNIDNIDIFPRLSLEIKDKYGNYTPAQALSKIVEEKSKQEEVSKISVAGLSINYDVAAIVIPFLGGLIIVYLWVAIGHLQNIYMYNVNAVVGFPWLGTVKIRIGYWLFIFSIVALPTASISGLVFTLWGHSSLVTKSYDMLMIILVLLTGLAITRRISKFRHELFSAHTNERFNNTMQSTANGGD